LTIETWEDHLLSTQEDNSSTKGLHPLLKEAVVAVTGNNLYSLPKPDAVYRLLLSEFGDVVDDLFLGGKCATIV
jgi:hypothetical protein